MVGLQTYTSLTIHNANLQIHNANLNYTIYECNQDCSEYLTLFGMGPQGITVLCMVLSALILLCSSYKMKYCSFGFEGKHISSV